MFNFTGRLPTTDLYFLNSYGKHVGGLFQKKPIKPLSSNCFLQDQTVLLIRKDNTTLMQHLLTSPPQKFLYLIDDDMEGAKDDSSLPYDYRMRLNRFHHDYSRHFVAQADTLMVSSPLLLDVFSNHKDVRLIHPIWHREPADDRHFDGLEQGGPLHAVHVGTGSHRAGLTFLKPILKILLERHERFHFTYIGERLLGALDDHPRIHRLPHRSWWHYRWRLPRMRFHIALYPLPNTPFNRARSRNKILEHGLLGAVGVYSRSWPLSEVIQSGAILADDSPESWIAALTPFLREPEHLRCLVKKAQPILRGMNCSAPQNLVWQTLFSPS